MGFLVNYYGFGGGKTEISVFVNSFSVNSGFEHHQALAGRACGLYFWDSTATNSWIGEEDPKRHC